jgi:hypothetical protein
MTVTYKQKLLPFGEIFGKVDVVELIHGNEYIVEYEEIKSGKKNPPRVLLEIWRIPAILMYIISS